MVTAPGGVLQRAWAPYGSNLAAPTFNLRAPSAIPQPKAAVYQVYNTAGTLVATWLDGPEPRFSVRADGPDGWTVLLPYLQGEFSQAGARGIADNYRVDVYVTSSDSLSEVVEADIYTTTNTYGDGGTYGIQAAIARLVYSGKVIGWETRTADLVLAVDLAPRSRTAELAYVPAGATYSGDPVMIAREVVEDTASELLWDVANPVEAGHFVGPLTLGGQSLAAALGTLRDLCGPRWFVTVTPEATIRLFDPTVGGIHHTLIDGVTCRGTVLRQDGVNRRKRIDVQWSGGTVTRTAPDYQMTDPRTERVTGSALTTEGDAGRLAEQTLARLDRMEERGGTVVLSGYDLEAIRVGDLASVFVEDASEVSGSDIYGTGLYGDGGTYGNAALYGGGNLPIAELSYSFSEVAIVFTRPSPDPIRQLQETARQARQAAEAVL